MKKKEWYALKDGCGHGPFDSELQAAEEGEAILCERVGAVMPSYEDVVEQAGDDISCYDHALFGDFELLDANPFVHVPDPEAAKKAWEEMTNKWQAKFVEVNAWQKAKEHKLCINYESLRGLQKALEDARNHVHKPKRMVREGARTCWVDADEDE